MNSKKVIKIILSLTILLGLILYAGNIYSADNNVEILLKGIFEAYMSQGESGLREYGNTQKKIKGLSMVIL